MVTMGLHPGSVKLKHLYEHPIFNCVIHRGMLMHYKARTLHDE